MGEITTAAKKKLELSKPALSSKQLKTSKSPTVDHVKPAPGLTHEQAIPVPVALRVLADRALLLVRDPRVVAVPEGNGRVVRLVVVPGLGDRDGQGTRQATGDVDGLRGVDAGLVTDLVPEAVEDGRLERVGGAVVRDLVVHKVHSALADRVGREIGGVRAVPDSHLAGHGVVRRVLVRQAEDVGYLRGEAHGRELHGGPDAVATGFLAVANHQEGGSGRLFRKDLHEVLLELGLVFRGVHVLAQVGKALGVGFADVGQAVLVRVVFRDVDFRVGSHPREKQR